MSLSRPNRPPAQAGVAASDALKVVAIGGGTGLATLLKGFKHFVRRADGSKQPLGPVIGELTAVVTVTDDGGSSGKLRKDFNILPPGDIRNCIVALSQDEALMARLFQYRFPATSGLSGHSFGNLFLTALTALTGDFAEAVRLGADILATCGHIYPATTANVNLEACMTDGSVVQGETAITASKHRIREVRLVPGDVEPLPQTLEAISRADLITIGPGSLYTSLAPNLLVRGIPRAIARSHALKAFVCNLMTQANESLGLTAADHVSALDRHAGTKIFDIALINDKALTSPLKAKYALEGATQIVADIETMEAMGVQPILGEYLGEDGVARHASRRVAQDLLELALHARDTGSKAVGGVG